MRSMKTLSLFAAVALTTGLAAQFARASDARDASELHELLRSGLPREMSGDDKLSLVHMLPDQDVLAATDASSIDVAVGLIKRTSLAKLTKETQSIGSGGALIADDIL